ncbi:DedA family protein [Corallococcus sp. AB049A]|uniref:DedA family protein n=1 Tax=Corallococcus interemptor TaxID=2316720 RepID=A0A3A8R855_9BACT|nr:MULTISPECIES: VTT domain-containing protein [Corallococcus]RKH51962.1 DedA family protein [Corallococcus sp. AB050B]RKH73452.1 DedA family protein [Corallococcus interemptor]RKI68559.1 DedA family protein [Corallococcus sp. AB049A]
MSSTEPSSPTAPATPAADAPKLSWYRRLYLRVEAASSTPHALATMMAVSVVDGSVFPIPPFAVLVPMVLAQPKKWVRYCLLGTLASLVGGLIGYALGAFVGEGVAQLLHIDLNVRVDRFGVSGTVGELLGQNFWVLALLCSILPTPFKIVAIGSGLVSVPLERFLLASIIGRSVRFFLVGGVVRFFGPTARKWLRV